MQAEISVGYAVQPEKHGPSYQTRSYPDFLLNDPRPNRWFVAGL